jgi:hypothetical protein
MSLLKYAKFEPIELGTVDVWKNRLHLITGPIGSGKTNIILFNLYEIRQRQKKKDGISNIRCAIWVMKDTPQVDKIRALFPSFEFMTVEEFSKWLKANQNDKDFIKDDASKIIVFDDVIRTKIFKDSRDNPVIEFLLNRRHLNLIVFINAHKYLDIPDNIKQYCNILTSFGGNDNELKNVCRAMNNKDLKPIFLSKKKNDSISHNTDTNKYYLNNNEIK